jgi:hypothetical protein
LAGRSPKAVGPLGDDILQGVSGVSGVGALVLKDSELLTAAVHVPGDLEQLALKLLQATSRSAHPGGAVDFDLLQTPFQRLDLVVEEDELPLVGGDQGALVIPVGGRFLLGRERDEDRGQSKHDKGRKLEVCHGFRDLPRTDWAA